MSTQSNPFEEIEQFFDQMSRRFDETTPTAEPRGERRESMAVDLVERDDEFVVTVDLPGFEKADVDVRVTDHTLRIDADHEDRTDDQSTEYLRRERRHRSVRRSIRLPENVDTAAVGAEMTNGVLTVTVPKLETTNGETIEIE